MKLQPIRAEFAIAGAALLFTLAWAWEDLRTIFGWPEPLWIQYFLPSRGPQATTGAWVFAAGVVVGLAYVIGSFVVQATFESPTRPMIKRLRDTRVEELRRADESLLSTTSIDPALANTSPRQQLLAAFFQPKRAQATEQSRGQDAAPANGQPKSARSQAVTDPPKSSWLMRRSRQLIGAVVGLPAALKRRGIKTPSPAELCEADSELARLVQSLGRSLLSDELNGQYNYRRGNRQVFMGVIPALFILPCDIGLWVMTLLHPGLLRIVIGFTVLVFAFGCVLMFYAYVLLSAAAYQEEIAQGLILDAAFLERWGENPTSLEAEAPKATPDTEKV